MSLFTPFSTYFASTHVAFCYYVQATGFLYEKYNCYPFNKILVQVASLSLGSACMLNNYIVRIAIKYATFSSLFPLFESEWVLHGKNIHNLTNLSQVAFFS